MTRSFLSILAVVLLVSLMTGCKKDDSSTSSDQFTDNLKLGTGINASTMTISGETTAFPATANNMIYWRLESKDDMAGSSVTMKIEKNVNGTLSTVVPISESSELWSHHAFRLSVECRGKLSRDGNSQCE